MGQEADGGAGFHRGDESRSWWANLDLDELGPL